MIAHWNTAVLINAIVCITNIETIALHVKQNKQLQQQQHTIESHNALVEYFNFEAN